jgi:phosphoribosyl 1,2-cyclic phosphate phosphodiesterase
MIIDMGPDASSAAFSYGKSLVDVRYHLQTHPHSDHFDPQVFSTRAPEYLAVDPPPLEVYGSLKTLERMAKMVAGEGYVDDFLLPDQQQRLHLNVVPVEPLRTYQMGRYKVIPFWANHDDSVESLLYCVSQGRRTIFYGTDTDVIPEESWRGFHMTDLQFNVVVLDHTYGPGAYNGGHLDADRFVSQIQRMKDERLLSEDARVLATHISHEGNPTHNELSDYAAQFGYEIAYDGLVLKL